MDESFKWNMPTKPSKRAERSSPCDAKMASLLPWRKSSPRVSTNQVRTNEFITSTNTSEWWEENLSTPSSDALAVLRPSLVFSLMLDNCYPSLVTKRNSTNTITVCRSRWKSVEDDFSSSWANFSSVSSIWPIVLPCICTPIHCTGSFGHLVVTFCWLRTKAMDRNCTASNHPVWLM